MPSDMRDYDHDRDWPAVKRIHFEVGWLEGKRDAKAFARLARAADGVVLPLDGVAECAVFTVPGAMRHLDADIDMTAVIAVTTSRVARRLGAAKRLTAHAVARQAAVGSELASLGMFEQGFYDHLGFGTGAYENRLRFDPQTLAVTQRFRPPKRLGRKQWRDIHAAMQDRLRGHGGCVLHPPEHVRNDLASVENAFGLGYHDGPGGALSHFIWGRAKGEHGPYDIFYYAYRSPEQLFELLALIRSLGDQVSSFSMEEPPEIQLQDLLREPFRNQRITEGAKHESGSQLRAYWQARILDLPKCLAKTRLDAQDATFNLALTDPIAEHLPQGGPWRGIAGDYVVTLGEQSAATPGTARGLPTLTASVGAFTRLWLGVRSASSLSLTDHLRADPPLLDALDRALRLPQPRMGWDF